APRIVLPARPATALLGADAPRHPGVVRQTGTSAPRSPSKVTILDQSELISRKISRTVAWFLTRLIVSSRVGDISLLKAGIQTGYGGPAVRMIAWLGFFPAPSCPRTGSQGSPLRRDRSHAVIGPVPPIVRGGWGIPSTLRG